MSGSRDASATEYLLALFTANVPHPAPSDLKFRPEEAWLKRKGRSEAQGPLASDVVDEALKG